MGVCGCVIPNPNCLCHSTPNYMVTMPKSVLDQIGKEHTEEIKRLRQQVEDLALVARGAAYRIKDTKKSQRFLAMIDKAVGGK